MRALVEQSVEVRGIALQRRKSPADGRDQRNQRFGQHRLERTEALALEPAEHVRHRLAPDRRQDADQVARFGACVEQGGVAGQGLGVGSCLADLGGDFVVGVVEVDPAHVRGVGLAHLGAAIAQGHDAGGGAGRDIGLGQDEGVGPGIEIELLGDVAGELDVLLLVLADGHVAGTIKQDVGRLEHGIVEQGDRCPFLVLARLVLPLRHSAEPTHAGGAVQEPAQFGMGGDVGLGEQDRLGRIDPAGDQGGGHGADLGAAAIGGDRLGQRVEVGEKEQAGRVMLHPLPAQDRAEQIAEVQAAGRLDARHDAGHGGGCHWVASLAGARRRRSVAIASRSTPPIRKAMPK